MLSGALSILDHRLGGDQNITTRNRVKPPSSGGSGRVGRRTELERRMARHSIMRGAAVDGAGDLAVAIDTRFEARHPVGVVPLCASTTAIARLHYWSASDRYVKCGTNSRVIAVLSCGEAAGLVQLVRDEVRDRPGLEPAWPSDPGDGPSVALPGPIRR